MQFWHGFHCTHCFPYHPTSQPNMSIILNHLQVYCPVRSAPGDALDTATIWLAIILPTVAGPALSFILCVSWITQDIVTCVRDVLANCPAVFLSYFSLWICYEIQPAVVTPYTAVQNVALVWSRCCLLSKQALLKISERFLGCW